MIAEIIKILQENDFYGKGEYIDIAKGKNEMVTTWKGFVRKLNRLWR